MASLELLRRTRWIAFASLLAFGTTTTTACAPAAGEETWDDTEGQDDTTPVEEDGPEDYLENDETRVDEVTDLSHTVVKRQSIGNCWLYATVGWIESMRKRYSGQEINISESYLTYWDWYEKITTGDGIDSSNHLETGGHWGTAVDLIRKRGYMLEADFLPEEATMEMSAAQSRALATLNESLESGALSTPEARENGTLVRDELDRAFGLRPELIAEMDRLFYASGSRSIENTTARRDFVKRPTQIAVGATRTSTGTRRTLTLSDVIGRARSTYGNPDQRSGTYAWQGTSYPRTSTERTRLMRRVLKAMNDGHPVIISWLVDFNGLDSTGGFRIGELQNRGVGRQGGHLTVLEDYVVDNVPGYGTLGIGQLPTEQRNAALDGTVRFLRIKNSWGASRSDRASNAGYYDLYTDYLNGPISWVDGEGANAPRTQRTPFSSVILPPGY